MMLSCLFFILQAATISVRKFGRDGGNTKRAPTDEGRGPHQAGAHRPRPKRETPTLTHCARQAARAFITHLGREAREGAAHIQDHTRGAAPSGRPSWLE